MVVQQTDLLGPLEIADGALVELAVLLVQRLQTRLAVLREGSPLQHQVIDMPSQLQGQQTLDEGEIDDRAGEAGMVRVALLVQRDGALEVLERLRVITFAPDDAPARGGDVAQRDPVIGLGQDRFSRIQHLQRAVRLAALEQHPTLLDLENGDQDLRIGKLSGELFRQTEMMQGLVVVRLFSVRPALPEMRQRGELGAENLVLEPEDIFERLDAFFDRVRRKRVEGLGHLQADVFAHLQVEPVRRRKQVDATTQELRLAVAHVDPLRQREQEAGRDAAAAGR